LVYKEKEEKLEKLELYIKIDIVFWVTYTEIAYGLSDWNMGDY
jgi:hypothetical protein